MTIKVYGMTGCSTVKKAQDWLADNQIAHDYARYDRMDDLAGTLDQLIDASALNVVLNTKSQAFRKLDDDRQSQLLADRAAAVRAMVDNPRLAKRPLAFANGQVLSGFVVAQWEAALK